MTTRASLATSFRNRTIAYWVTTVLVAAESAVLAPRFPRLKEWAYAGIVFNMTGAVASHVAVGDGAATLAAPITFTALAVASWVLRPPARRLSSLAPA